MIPNHAKGGKAELEPQKLQAGAAEQSKIFEHNDSVVFNDAYSCSVCTSGCPPKFHINCPGVEKQ